MSRSRTQWVCLRSRAVEGKAAELRQQAEKYLELAKDMVKSPAEYWRLKGVSLGLLLAADSLECS